MHGSFRPSFIEERRYALDRTERWALLSTTLANETFDDLTPEALHELRRWRPERWESEK